LVSLAGCGDDGGQASVDSGSGRDGADGPPVSVPAIRVTCETDACAAATTTNLVYFAFVLEDCPAVLASPGRTTLAAGRGATFDCIAGRCTGTSDDSPANWEDDSDALVNQLPSGDYGVTAWLDHNGNLLDGRGPDAGDTLCCKRANVGMTTASVDLATSDCTDL
jgi:hypothetical protein